MKIKNLWTRALARAADAISEPVERHHVEQTTPATPECVVRHLTLLPGVPIVESPFFAEILASNYFLDWEKPIAADLYENGYALLDFPDPDIANRAKRIIDELAPHYEAARKGGDTFNGSLQPPRFQDAFVVSDDVAAIANSDAIRALLGKLYGRPAFPFQTLTFQHGSQQHFHSDAVHFHSAPERFMCGVWVALEDVTEDNGPLIYYPGSQKWATFTNEHATAHQHDFLKPPSQAMYEPLWRALVAAHGAKRTQFLPKRGQALIWASCLLHGGEAIKKVGSTRWSQVTHYFFSNCAYFTAMETHGIAGKIAFRDPLDISTGERVCSMYADEKIPPAFIDACKASATIDYAAVARHLLPAGFDSATYLALNADVAKAGIDASMHYINHGKSEGRRYLRD